ncbi:MAG: hypothetical protein U0798_04590 [Gemmataceae bacterium]
MVRFRAHVVLGLFFGMVAIVGLAHSSDPKSVPDIIPVSFSEPERLPAPNPVAMPQVTSAATCISLDWNGPSSIRTNKPNAFVLTVRNQAETLAQRVVVQVRVPDGVVATDLVPEARSEKGILVWDLGTLAGKDVRDLRMNLTASEKRDLTCQAWVTVTGTSGLRVSVKEPKLEAAISAPTEVVLGDPIPVKYTVKNVGNDRAEIPTATVTMPSDSAQETQRHTLGTQIDINQTKTGESKWIATKGGLQTFALRAEAEGGLTAEARATVNVLVPKLTVAIAGPTERLVGRKATYTVTVMNEGTVPLKDVTVKETFPAAFRYISSSCANSIEPGAVTWKVGSLAAGEKKEYTYDAQAVCPGPCTHLVKAVGSRNTIAEASAKTLVSGIPAMRMEVVDLTDPVEKGGETTYEIRLTNTGTQSDTHLVLECHIPPEMTFVSATGPTKELERVGVDFNDKKPANRSLITFEPVAELSPKMEAVFRIKVKAQKSGDARFKATLTSTHLTSPVSKEESTRIYGE